MALEDAYINAVHGRAPDPQWLSEISSTKKLGGVVGHSVFRPARRQELGGFLTRPRSRRAILLRYAAEAKLAYFSWHWRFAVIFSMAKVIFGKRGDPTRSALRPDAPMSSLSSCETFLGRIISIMASRTWPERLQDELGLPMKRLREEGMGLLICCHPSN